jgi:hypothetical protein
MEQPGDRIEAYCNVCAGDRTHQVLFSNQQEWHEDEEDGWPYTEVSQYIVASCCGCHHRTFLNRWWNGGTDKIVTQYPPKTVRKKPDWYFQLSWMRLADIGKTPDLSKSELLTEIYSALGAGSTRLALMGIRALLEHIMIEQVGDHGTFEENLAAFEAKGCISSRQRESLSRIVDAGHASIHRAYKPPLEDVMFCLDVAELLIASIYIHPARSQRMSVPERPQRLKKSKAPPDTPPVA